MDENLIARQEHEEMKTRFDERMSRLEARMAEVETEVRDLIKSMMAIQRIELALENVKSDSQKIIKRLEELEREPAEKWKKTVWYVITAVLGAAIALIIKTIGGS